MSGFSHLLRFHGVFAALFKRRTTPSAFSPVYICRPSLSEAQHYKKGSPWSRLRGFTKWRRLLAAADVVYVPVLSRLLCHVVVLHLEFFAAFEVISKSHICVTSLKQSALKTQYHELIHVLKPKFLYLILFRRSEDLHISGALFITAYLTCIVSNQMEPANRTAAAPLT